MAVLSKRDRRGPRALRPVRFGRNLNLERHTVPALRKISCGARLDVGMPAMDIEKAYELFGHQRDGF
jgi:hypothetical protein